MAHWRFPINDGGQRYGINANYDAKFRAARIPSLAREIGQNSGDAAESWPVRIEYHSFMLPREKFPELDSYEKLLKTCAVFWENKGQENEVKKFRRALQCLKKDKIPFLRISDHNTTGVRKSGAEDEWENLIRSSGSSGKSADKGGSFGLGKAAPFACSDLMTILYSTYTNQEEHQHQGVAHFAYFFDDAGEEYQNVGYYCEDKNEAIAGELELDPDFHRNQGDYGTDIYVAGFFAEDDTEWPLRLLAAVVNHFTYAVYAGKLEVSANGMELTKANMSDFIKTYPDLIDSKGLYYDVLTSEKTHKYDIDFQGMGCMHLWLLTDHPRSTRKVIMTRQSGMNICAWNRFKNMPFAGLCYIEGTELNERLRKMENPEHTEWSEEYLDTKAEQLEGKNMRKKMRSMILEKIQGLFKNSDQQAMDAVGAGNLLPDDLPTDSETDNDSREKDAQESQGNQIIITNSNDPEVTPRGMEDSGETEPGPGQSADPTGDEAGFPGEKKQKDKRDQGGEGTPPQGRHGATPQKDGKSKNTEQVSVKLSSFHVICSNPNEGIYRMTAMPAADAQNAELVISLSAENDSLPAVIRSAACNGENLTIKNNSISGFSFKKGEKAVFSLTLDTDTYCGIEVKAYAAKG